jgi:hypothetical protein
LRFGFRCRFQRNLCEIHTICVKITRFTCVWKWAKIIFKKIRAFEFYITTGKIWQKSQFFIFFFLIFHNLNPLIFCMNRINIIQNKEETPSSSGVVWAYFLCCWASKSSCILVFRGFGKKTKIGWAPPVSSSWPAATIIFLVNYFKPNNSFLGHKQPP